MKLQMKFFNSDYDLLGFVNLNEVIVIAITSDRYDNKTLFFNEPIIEDANLLTIYYATLKGLKDKQKHSNQIEYYNKLKQRAQLVSTMHYLKKTKHINDNFVLDIIKSDEPLKM